MSRRSRSRSRSRSPRRDREDRRRKDDRDRKRDKKERRRRHRSSSSEASVAEAHQLGSILKEERRRRERSRERNSSPKQPPPPPPESSGDANIPFDINTLNESAKKWLEDRITEQVVSRVDKLEAMMTEKATAARNEMERMLRAQIESEMTNELEECKRRDEESRKRCKQLEMDLEKKIAESEESRRKFDIQELIAAINNYRSEKEENRLAMLEQKSQLERERAELARQKAEITKNEQSAILNKGGAARAPIKFKFGK